MILKYTVTHNADMFYCLGSINNQHLVTWMFVGTDVACVGTGVVCVKLLYWNVILPSLNAFQMIRIMSSCTGSPISELCHNIIDRNNIKLLWNNFRIWIYTSFISWKSLKAKWLAAALGEVQLKVNRILIFNFTQLCARWNSA